MVIKRHVHWKDVLLNSTTMTEVVIFTREKQMRNHCRAEKQPPPDLDRLTTERIDC